MAALPALLDREVRWTAMPSVTPTCKPAVSPVTESITGLAFNENFQPSDAAEQKPLSIDRFRKLLDAAPDAATRKILLASKVEDMINTVVRQIAFYDFESKVHAARREGELTPDDINALWMSVQAESLGPAFDFMPGYETFWSYIPHFVHTPFYVYAYAFGDGLVNALYAAYEEGLPDFQEKYFDLLKAGGSKHHKELLAPFGLDASDPAFWDKGLSLIAGFIDELEAMG